MIDATLSTFERDVIEASSDAPVLVTFWAPWCEPCKALHPMLERLEREYGGRFKVVNVNSDTNPELVASFNLKSIPYAVAFVDGNAVAQFSGAQPENFLRAFLDRLVPNPAHLEHRAAREAMALGQYDEAESCLLNAVALDPTADGARLDVIALLLDRNEIDRAREHHRLLSSQAYNQSTYAAVNARIQAVEAAALLPPLEELERRVELDANDLEARLHIADLHVARRSFPAALDQLLEVVRIDRNYLDDVGRKRILEVFEMAAEQQDLVNEYRRRLSRLLF